MLVSAAVLLLLLINTYGRQGLQTGLAAESASGEAAWHSYAPHLTLPRGEYRVLVGGYGPVVVRSGEGNLLGAGDAGEPFLIRLEKDESEVISMAGRRAYCSLWNCPLPGEVPSTATDFL